MNIIYTSQRPINDFPQYKINGKIIYIKYQNKIYKADFSSFIDGKLNTSLDFISFANKTNGELTVTLIQAVNKDGIPLEYDNDFEVTEYEELEIDWITQEEIDAINNVPQEPTTEEKLEELATDVKVAMQAVMILSLE